ncbi:MAG: ABC transporter substrate-binding protein [Spirochaetae bacterium HGW-Spirochaetae-3]|jgi:putative ABC transport system substrate-binding protein|nr:MAG: ABC transporter substrate-binding protein [Spirochaetae bacterium HGW-Spirochaetae-3]
MRLNSLVKTVAVGAAILAASGAFTIAAVRDVPIGIAKFVSHPALDDLERGIVDELTATVPGVRFDLQNANADMATAAQIARKFKSDKVRVAVGIATPTAQALASAIKEIPVVFCAVTDPVAAGLVASYSGGGKNVTGTSDMTPVEAQLDFLVALKPIKRLGHVYNAGEANSVKLAELVKAYCDEKGIELVVSTVANSAEVRAAVQAIAGRIDGLYLGNDNTVFSAVNAVAEVCIQKRLPLVTADPTSAETVPVLGALGFDYYEMGRSTGRMVARVLAGENPGSMPTYFATAPAEKSLVLNLDVAARLGISPSADMISRATVIIRNGTVERRKK